jgi:hypothetical protein
MKLHPQVGWLPAHLDVTLLLCESEEPGQRGQGEHTAQGGTHLEERSGVYHSRGCARGPGSITASGANSAVLLVLVQGSQYIAGFPPLLLHPAVLRTTTYNSCNAFCLAVSLTQLLCCSSCSAAARHAFR